MSCKSASTRRQSASKRRVQASAKKAGHTADRKPAHRITKVTKFQVVKAQRRSTARRPVPRRTNHTKPKTTTTRPSTKAKNTAKAGAKSRALTKKQAAAHALRHARASARARATARATARRTLLRERRQCALLLRKSFLNQKAKRKSQATSSKAQVPVKTTKASRAQRGRQALRELQAQQARIASYGP
jgi:hypothetical protein